ncbi:MAG: PTS sugar transporter subunit IIA [Kiritimatiellae bacterium]|jgi:PTS system nitrogen regulatory IIA component|nr:PTS sugar transporter subunit IIA [Kiritimatiellia bacterium]
MKHEDILTVEEVAKILKVSERTVYDWAKRGDIPCGKLGSTWRFKRDDVAKWVDSKLSKSSSASAEVMQIKSVLSEDNVLFIDSETKEEALSLLIEKISEGLSPKDKQEITEGIFHREKLMSTGIGLGIAVPHVRLSSLNTISMVAALHKKGIESYGSIDGKGVNFLFMIVAGKEQHSEHIKLLSAISRTLKNEGLRKELFRAESTSDFYNLITE